MSSAPRKSSCKGGKRKTGDQPSLPPSASTPSDTSLVSCPRQDLNSMHLHAHEHIVQHITIPAGNNGVHPQPPNTGLCAVSTGSANFTPAANLSALPPSSQQVHPPPLQPSYLPQAQPFMGAPPGFHHPPPFTHLPQLFMQPPPGGFYPAMGPAPPSGLISRNRLPSELCYEFSPSPPVSPAATTKPTACASKGKSVARSAKVKAATKGRRPGARGYTDCEKLFLAKLALKYMLISMEGWQRVTTKYNSKAEVHKLPSRELKGLRQKFESVSCEAIMLILTLVLMHGCRSFSKINLLVVVKCLTIKGSPSKPMNRSHSRLTVSILTTTSLVQPAPMSPLAHLLQQSKSVIRKITRPLCLHRRSRWLR